MPALGTPVSLSDNVFIVYSEFPHRHSANSYLILGAHPVLIDCGSARAAPQLLANLDYLSVHISKIKAVIATHGDYDHVQGFPTLLERNPELRLMIHPGDWPSDRPDARFRNCSYLYDQPFLAIDHARCVEIEDGVTLLAGDGQLQVLHTPGHTDGSVCLHGTIDGRTVLFTGDVFGGAMKSIENADVSLWAKSFADWHLSLNRLSAQAFDWVLNGHEPASTLPLSRAHFDAAVRRFGHMFNPWFSLGEDEAEEPSFRVTAEAPVVSHNWPAGPPGQSMPDAHPREAT